MSAPTALYRRYRPDSFATVIGQEHVTAPLMAALEKNRVNHAYLFSGPRGCGKTTSARILARCLNCAKGPTSHPCGECDSCIELARGGSGSLDVIEIDAASHGGVDDARDLRERATFAPIRDRYKIFIIDEAHMVTSAGFNALLKIVEEPPEHIKFIFATTEPDKVIGTIRSRTHHYPFRLVPPEPLMAYLAQLCEQENVAVAPGVLSLVVRAGGGSVRDSLSVLDQLMAGAGDSGLDYDLAVDLLGYTHSSLLDDVVEALAAADSATVFKSVDRVIQTGHDPRRFVEDLLERFRDLIIVQAMPESAHAILRGTPDELIARMQTQAAQLGAAELSRAADVTNAAFNDMTGASSPRLHLELLGARLLLPSADSSTRGMATRLDQLERRLNYSGAPAGNAPAPAMAAPEQSAPAASFTSPSTTAAPADPAGATTGGGLAAVRAQLARAKEAAGAAVEARHASEDSIPPSPTGEPAPAAASPEAAPTPATAPSEPAPNQPAAASGRSWDDLPTPSNSAQTSAPQSASGAQSPAPAAAQPSEQPQQTPAQPVAPQQSQQQGQWQSTPTTAQNQAPAQQAPQQAPTPTEAANAPASSSGIEVIRRAWPEILGSLRNIRMASWVIVNQNVVPQTFDGQELRVGLPSTGLISTFSNGGHLQNLQTAIDQVLGLSIQILPVDGEAPKASAEPNPKAPAGSPSPQREGNNNTVAPQALQSQPSQQASAAPTAPAPTAPAPTVPTTASTQQPAGEQASATGSTAVTTMETTESREPVQSLEAAQSGEPDAAQSWGSTHALVDHAAQAARSWGISQPSAPAATAVSASSPQAAPNQQEQQQQQPIAANAQVTWDGPMEPSDPWDEPHTDAYPHEDPYAGIPTESGFTQTPDHSPEPTSSPESAANRAAGATPEPAAPPVHVPPKVSPIAAWTTGWDTPVDEPVAAELAASETPKRSEILARQIAAQGTQPQEAPQDWGVSLGQVSRNTVADPGWGNISEAPDWAQDGTSPAEAAPAEEVAAAQVSEPSESAGVPDVPFNAALPVAGQPLGASTAYPTPAQTSTQPAAQQQEAPPSDMDAGEKLSMYQRLSNSSEAQAGRVKASAITADTPYVEDVPSPDDVTIEESGVVGQAAVERILGGVLVEERPMNPTH